MTSLNLEYTARLAFWVGVSSPASWVRSRSRIAKRAIRSQFGRQAPEALEGRSRHACSNLLNDRSSRLPRLRWASR